MNRVLLFGLSTVLLTGCLGPQRPAPVVAYGLGKGPGSAGVHVVADGDTLWSLSQRYGMALQDIAYANNLQAPFVLSPGQRLNLPPPQQYRVRSGDTLYGISRLFNVQTSQIARLNRLQAPYAIQPGQTLRLPSFSGGREPEASVMVARPAEAVPPQAEPAAGGAAQDSPVRLVSAETKERQEKIQEKITAKTPPRSSGKFLKPVEGKTLSSYGPKKDGLHNDGINIKAPKGTPVRAAENGVVVYAGNDLKGTGNLVLIRHEGRWMSAYAHMDDMLIKRGDTVKRGQSIGTVGVSGAVSEPQLHFELRRGTRALNPEQYMEPGSV